MTDTFDLSRFAAVIAKHGQCAHHMGVRRISEPDREILTMPFGEHLLDREDGTATFKPIKITVDFLRGGKTVETYAAAKIIRMGRRLAVVEAWGWQ